MVVQAGGPALGRLRQEDSDFRAVLGYIIEPCLQNQGAGDVADLVESLLSMH